MGNNTSSNLATPTSKNPVNTGFFSLSAPKKSKSAPSIYELEFEVEGPYSKTDTEMLNQIKSIDCGGDLNKRWYVEYYVLDNQSKKRVRKRDYGFINKFKEKDLRYQALNDLRATVLQKLESSISQNDDFKYEDTNNVTYYMNEYLRIKRRTLEKESNKLYTGSLKVFHAFLKTRNATHLQPHLISKQLINDFINEQCKTMCNRSVNNHFENVKGFFSFLIKNYDNVLIKNPCAGILKLPSKSENHIAYSKKQAQEISEYLKENDMAMLQFCRFVAYGFLRCKETRNLKIGDIDFDKRTITLSAQNAKTNRRTVKPILNTLFQYLIEMDLQKYPSNYYVFSIGGKPSNKKTYTNHFQKKYQKVKKHFGLNEKYTIYSFRHTFVCELLDSGASWHEIMKYTGHTTFSAFEKYARSILNKPATDLSSSININF